jgi:hypothetical protein
MIRIYYNGLGEIETQMPAKFASSLDQRQFIDNEVEVNPNECKINLTTLQFESREQPAGVVFSLTR